MNFSFIKRFTLAAGAGGFALLASAQQTPSPPAAFEVVSIKPVSTVTAGTGARGAALGATTTLPATCSRTGRRVSPGQFRVASASVYGLIVMAYNKNCLLISGGPQWTRSDTYEVVATLPTGSPFYGSRQLENGNAPKLQEMIRTLLAERFKLSFHTELREMAVYNLVVSKRGRNIVPSSDQDAPDFAERSSVIQPCRPPATCATVTSLSTLGDLWSAVLGRPIVDRTNLKGVYDVVVNYDPDVLDSDPIGARIAAIEDQLGLKLTPARSSVEVIVIDAAARPAAN